MNGRSLINPVLGVLNYAAALWSRRDSHSRLAIPQLSYQRTINTTNI